MKKHVIFSEGEVLREFHEFARIKEMRHEDGSINDEIHGAHERSDAMGDWCRDNPACGIELHTPDSGTRS